MSSRAALARHPLAIAGVVITTVAAVVFIALAIAVVVRAPQQPVRRPGRLRRHSGALRPRAAADSARGCGCSGGRCGGTRTRSPNGRCVDFRKAIGPPHGARDHRADRRQSGHPAARRVRHAALDGIAVFLRAGVPRADASAVHGVAGERRIRACAAPSAISARAPARSCTTSWSASGSCITWSRTRFRGRSRVSPTCDRHSRSAETVTRPNEDFGRSRPRHPRIRRRRNELRDDDGPADARSAVPVSRPARAARFTGTRIRGSRSSSSRPTRNGRRFRT